MENKKRHFRRKTVDKNIVAELDNENNIQIYEKYRPQQVIKNTGFYLNTIPFITVQTYLQK